MIRVICGLNGSGKSCYATWLAANMPLNVVTNFPLTKRHPRFGSAVMIGSEEFPVLCEGCLYGVWDLGFRNKVILIDEADVFFDCFSFEFLRGAAWQWFKQHRKYGLELIFVVQNPATLYNRLRMLAGEYIWCERDQPGGVNGHWALRFLPDFLLLWRRAVYLDSGFQHYVRQDNQLPRSVRPVFSWYNTRYQVSPVMQCPRCHDRLKDRNIREAVERLRRERYYKAALDAAKGMLPCDESLESRVRDYLAASGAVPGGVLC
jgi:hypothetical protein